ncbi:MAG: LysR family transcriptional regulator [Solirubrobacterales bacterium]
MELRQLRIFAAVADLQSFTRAAEALGYAQSNITAQVRCLEDELGVRLFERLGRRIALTLEGERLLSYSERILKLAGEAKESISGGEPNGTINIGVPESLCVFRLPDLFREYRRQHPQVKLILKLGTPIDFRRWLRDNTIDISFFLDRKVEDPDLVVRELLVEPMVIICEKDHRLASSSLIEAADVAHECVIFTERGCSYRAQLEAQLAEAGVQPASTLEFESVEAIKQFVMSGMGIALLPRAAVEKELAQGKLAQLTWKGTAFDMRTQLVYHRGKWVSPTLKSLLDFVEDYFGAKPSLAAVR